MRKRDIRAGRHKVSRNHGSSGADAAGMVAGHGRVDPHSLLDHGYQVRQLADAVNVDGGLGGKGAADFGLELRVHGGVPAEVVDGSDENGCGCVGGGDDDDLEAALELAERDAAGLFEMDEGVRHAVVCLVRLMGCLWWPSKELRI